MLQFVTARPAPVADLLHFAGLKELDGLAAFCAFPDIMPDAVWPEDEQTFVLVHDNTFPGAGGRAPSGSGDPSEFILVRLPRSLPR